MEQQIHGGNIYDKNIYNKEITLDYSVNINPLGMPQEVCNAITQDIGGYQTYPDIKYTALRNAIACKESINADNIYKVNINAKNILCGNGASELIMAVVRAVHPEKCAIAAPSFSGYERAVKAYGAGIVYYELDSNNGFSYEYVSGRLEQLDVQLCFICNPNNPTGNIIPENILINILDICRRRNIIVVVDECFLRFNRNYERYDFFFNTAYRSHCACIDYERGVPVSADRYYVGRVFIYGSKSASCGGNNDRDHGREDRGQCQHSAFPGISRHRGSTDHKVWCVEGLW